MTRHRHKEVANHAYPACGTLGLIIWRLVDRRFLFGPSRPRPTTRKIGPHGSDGLVPRFVIIDIYGIPAIARVAFSFAAHYGVPPRRMRKGLSATHSLSTKRVNSYNPGSGNSQSEMRN